MANEFSRRYFFYGSLLAGVVPAGGFGSVPSLRTLGYKSPNEKLNIAAIGAGGKASSDIDGCRLENIVALCDVDDKRAADKFKEYEKTPKYKEFRKMLDAQGKDIDACIVTVPDFMHATAAVNAMERGKHVYVQKPLVRTVWEARLMQDTANKYKVATQMGNQGYSNEGTRQAAEMVWAGEIGDVTEVHAWTDRPWWPQAPGRHSCARRGPGYARLAGVARQRRGAALHVGRRRLSESVRQLLSALQLARLFRLRLRRSGRHGLPYPGRSQYGAAPRRAVERRVPCRRKASATSSSRKNRLSVTISRRAAACRP